MRALALLALVLPAFTGCFGAAEEDLRPATNATGLPTNLPASLVPPANVTGEPAASPPVVLPAPSLSAAGERVRGDAPLRFTGALKAVAEEECLPFSIACSESGTPCTPSSCLALPFEVGVPDGWWEEHEGFLEFSVTWEHETGWFLARIYDPAGNELGEVGYAYYSTLSLLAAPAPGRYVAVVQAFSGEGAFEGVLQVESKRRSAEVRELLPNLVTLPPKDLRLVVDSYTVPLTYAVVAVPAPYRTALRLAGSEGCGPDEVTEGMARKCLRLSNAVGNAGEGTLEVRLGTDKTSDLVADRAQYVQRIYATDGSFRDVPVGTGKFHPTHGHLHYDGLARFEVFHYDWDAKARGAMVNTGKKAGFCMANEGLTEPGATGTTLPSYPVCEAFTTDTHWVMGISPGWFDRYETYRPDQYVEVSGIADGIYELVSTANWDQSIVESSYEDNEASVVFRLAGSEIEVLAVSAPVGAE